SREVGAPTGNERREQSDEDDDPEQDPHTQHTEDGVREDEGHEEEHDEDRLEDHEHAVGRRDAPFGVGRDVTARPRKQEQQRRRAGERRREEESTEHPASVTPHGLVRYGQEDAGVPADEDAERRAEHAPDDPGTTP